MKNNYTKIKIIIADDDKENLDNLLLSLIECNDDTISAEERKTLIKQCFEIKVYNDYKKLTKEIEQKLILADIIFLDVNFEKNAVNNNSKKKELDLRFQGIEIAKSITQNTPSTKIILNTAYGEYKNWKNEFEKLGYEIKDKFLPTDSNKCIYRKQKNIKGQEHTEDISHIIKPMLLSLAAKYYKCATAGNKKTITAIKNIPDTKIFNKIKETIITTHKIEFSFIDLFYFDAEIKRIQNKIEVHFHNLKDALNEILIDSNVTKQNEVPKEIGPYRSKAIRDKYIEFINTDKENLINSLKESIENLIQQFLDFEDAEKIKKQHSYSGKYTLDSFKKNENKITSLAQKFSTNLMNNIIVRIAVVVIHNYLENNSTITIKLKSKSTSEILSIVRQFIDKPESTLDGYSEQDLSNNKSFYTTKLGLSNSEQSDFIPKNELTLFEQSIYDNVYSNLP